MSDEKAVATAIKVGVGAAAGVASGVANAAAPHVRAVGSGAVNASSSFFNGATKALRNHKGITGALGAGTVAVVGHGVVGTAIIAAAPVVAVTAAVGAVAGGTVFGLFKLYKALVD